MYSYLHPFFPSIDHILLVRFLFLFFSTHKNHNCQSEINIALFVHQVLFFYTNLHRSL